MNQPGTLRANVGAGSAPPATPRPPAEGSVDPAGPRRWRVIARNVGSYWSGRAVDALTAFFLARFLVRTLGLSQYGLWAIIGLLASYFGFFDFGVQGTVARFLAFHRAHDDRERINTTLSTAIVIMTTLGTIAIVLGLVFVAVAPRIFHDVEPHEWPQVRWAMVIVLLSWGLSFPLNVFDATLWSAQRLDVNNAVDILGSITRLVLTFLIIGRGYGLVALSLIAMTSILGTGLAKLALSFLLDRDLRVGFRYVRRAEVRPLFAYSVWRFLMSAPVLATALVIQPMIAAIIGLASVTLYSLAMRLSGYAEQVVLGARAALTPVATEFHAREDQEQQERLFLLGGCYCLALALYLATLFVLLGRPFMILWVGPDLAKAGELLAILALGEVLPNSQMVTQGILLGMARHKVISLLMVAEKATAIVLALVLERWWGLTGVVIGLEVPAFLARGVAQLVYGCHVVGAPLTHYLTRALVPAVAAAIVPAAALAALVAWRTPNTWVTLFLYGAVFTGVYGVSVLLVLARGGGRRRLLGPLAG